MADLSMDVGVRQFDIGQAISGLRRLLEQEPEAIEHVDLEEIKDALLRLAELEGFVSNERMLTPWRAERQRQREAA